MSLRAPLLALFLAMPAFTPIGQAETGHRALIQGKGTPTVVFEAGLGDTLEVWKRVQPEISRWTRTF